MKVYRRKILTDEGYKLVTIYEVLGKLGTHGTTVFFLFDKPEIGKRIKCIHDGHGGVVTSANLMHQTVATIIIDRIREDGFIYTYLI